MLTDIIINKFALDFRWTDILSTGVNTSTLLNRALYIYLYGKHTFSVYLNHRNHFAKLNGKQRALW